MCVSLRVGPNLSVKETGDFSCVVCGNTLFKTDVKFDSGTGWPSFSDVASKSDSVVRVADKSHGMVSHPYSGHNRDGPSDNEPCVCVLCV